MLSPIANRFRGLPLFVLVAKPPKSARQGENEKANKEDNIALDERDVIFGEVDGIPSIRSRIEFMISMANAIIIKLLVRKIGFNALSRKLYALWKTSQTVQLKDLENDIIWLD
ncbi:hypothetical protein Gohar_003149 [Gossypium harknessii]|uniref:Uncharacterized protein n=1 Tax=Gossypium harknessii TaxID=34285 RepID=A0A7J9HN45_9ROSI|nr:hypothetical protein [Gossypium harknessii]